MYEVHPHPSHDGAIEQFDSNDWQAVVVEDSMFSAQEI